VERAGQRSGGSSQALKTTAARGLEKFTNEAHDWVYQNIRTLQALTTKPYYLNYAGERTKHGQKMGGTILPGNCGLALARSRVLKRSEGYCRAILQRVEKDCIETFRSVSHSLAAHASAPHRCESVSVQCL
jgi:hypothetical protein